MPRAREQNDPGACRGEAVDPSGQSPAPPQVPKRAVEAHKFVTEWAMCEPERRLEKRRVGEDDEQSDTLS